jgi:hypothetical protein
VEAITALRAEEARLEAALRLTPEYRQLEAVRAALAALKGAFVVVPEPPSEPEWRAKGITHVVTRVVVKEFHRIGLRAQTKDLRAAFRGVETGRDYDYLGASIASVLSANKAMFDKKTDHRGDGWGLVEWSQPAGTIEVAPAPSFLLLAPRNDVATPKPQPAPRIGAEVPLAYSPKDALRLLGCGMTFLYAEISAGRLEARKAGKKTLILAESLRAYLAARPKADIQMGRAAS